MARFTGRTHGSFVRPFATMCRHGYEQSLAQIKSILVLNLHFWPDECDTWSLSPGLTNTCCTCLYDHPSARASYIVVSHRHCRSVTSSHFKAQALSPVHTQEPAMKLLVVAALAALVAVVSASGDPTESLPGVQDLSESWPWSRVEASGGRTAMQRAVIAVCL